jgi:hypothetical protein
MRASPKLDEIGDVALLEEEGVEPPRRGELGEFTRHDENQLAARAQMAHCLGDEMKVEIAAPVEHFVIEQSPRVQRDVLVTHIGRIADDRVELLRQRQSEEIHHARARGGDRRIDLDRLAACDAARKGALAGGRIERAPKTPAQREHLLDHGGRGKHLAQGVHVELSGHTESRRWRDGTIVIHENATILATCWTHAPKLCSRR